MKRRSSDIIIFILSLITLIISLVLLKMFGAYEIQYGNGTLVVDGGWFMIIMNILRVTILFVLCVFSGIRMFKKPK